MCDTAMRVDPGTINLHLKGVLLRMPSVLLFSVPDHFKTQEMCDKAVTGNPYMLGHIPDHFKTQAMCTKAVEEDLSLLRHVLHHF